MKKFLGVLALALTLALTLVPLQAHAEERIGVKFNNGNLYVKPGPVTAAWQQLTSGVSIGDFDLAGDYISLINTGGGNPNTMMLKQPSWNSPFNYVHLNTASKVAMTKTSDGLYRIVILQTNGSVVMKDGAWNTGYWSGTLEASGVTDIVVGGDNVGIIKSNGDFKAKKLTPGQFSHPNNTAWQLVATDVDEAAMTNTRMAILSGGAVYAKEGGITSPWAYNKGILFDYALNVFLSDSKLCARTEPNWEGSKVLQCSEGSVSNWTKYVYVNLKDARLNQERILVLANDNSVQVLEGSLTYNSGWRTIATQANKIELNQIP